MRGSLRLLSSSATSWDLRRAVRVKGASAATRQSAGGSLARTVRLSARRGSRPLKLAVVANEFMAPEIGRTGGFGWAARAVARVFRETPEAGVDVVFLTGEIETPDGRSEMLLDGTRLLFKSPHRWGNLARLYAERIDLILTIDYRPSYRPLLLMLPRTPVVVWARDPRTPADIARIDTLRLPGRETPPPGVRPFDCSLAALDPLSRVFGRRVLVASKFPHIRDKLRSVYGVGGSLVLPNPDVIDYGAVDRRKQARPRVVFLARLDPYKRPWLFVELARRFPDVEFLMLGRNHFGGMGGWEPGDIPGNVRMLGHVDGPEKMALLASSWVLVNTSIYEESPVSMLEALACEVPVLSCVDTGDLARRFGVYAGRFDGDGVQGLPALEAGLRHLLENADERARLGAEGRAWVMQEHNDCQFLEAFRTIAVEAGAIAPARLVAE